MLRSSSTERSGRLPAVTLYSECQILATGRGQMGLKMTSKGPLISVVVPHLNQPEALEACLSSLDAQSLARCFFEIIVVDNGSISNPECVVANHSRTRLLRELQPGPGPA